MESWWWDEEKSTSYKVVLGLWSDTMQLVGHVKRVYVAGCCYEKNNASIRVVLIKRSAIVAHFTFHGGNNVSVCQTRAREYNATLCNLRH